VVSRAAIPEAFLVFVMIMAYIWKLRFTHPLFWLLPMALVLASHLVRHERARELGFGTRNFGNCLRAIGPALAGLAVMIWVAGLLLGTIRPQGFVQALQSFVVYLPWGLFQQYLINGYFLKRFEMGLSRRPARILTSALFCVAHSPNWFLMLVTPVAAFAAIGVYRRYGNLYFLGLAHATLGFAIFMVVPDSVTHHLKVGPGWFTWR
jgi:membrane protease YdiL (CAAX protease family)